MRRQEARHQASLLLESVQIRSQLFISRGMLMSLPWCGLQTAVLEAKPSLSNFGCEYEAARSVGPRKGPNETENSVAVAFVDEIKRKPAWTKPRLTDRRAVAYIKAIGCFINLKRRK